MTRYRGFVGVLIRFRDTPQDTKICRKFENRVESVTYSFLCVDMTGGLVSMSRSTIGVLGHMKRRQDRGILQLSHLEQDLTSLFG